MSETLEERLRRNAKHDDATLCKVYPGDVVELLDARDAEIAQLRADLFAAVQMVALAVSINEHGLKHGQAKLRGRHEFLAAHLEILEKKP